LLMISYPQPHRLDLKGPQAASAASRAVAE